MPVKTPLLAIQGSCSHPAWTTVVGVMYYAVQGVAVFFIYSNTQSYDISISVYDPLPYAILAFVMISYPLSGFIADVYCGRLKTVVISLCLLLSCAVLVCLVETALSTVKHSSYHNLSMVFHSQLEITVFILVLLSLALFIIGLAGYEANFIQLGLDQLFEASSQYLCLFVHYATWTFHLQWICTGANSLLITLVWTSEENSKSTAFIHNNSCYVEFGYVDSNHLLETLLVLHRTRTT